MARKDRNARTLNVRARSTRAIDRKESSPKTSAEGNGLQVEREPGTIRLLRDHGATETQLAIWNSAIRRESSITAPSQASRTCLRNCRQWSAEGAKAMRDSIPDAHLTFQRFDIGHDEVMEQRLLDIRAMKTRLLPQLKREFAASCTMIRPTVLGAGVGLSAFTLGLVSISGGGNLRARNPRSSSQPVLAPTVTVEIEDDQQLREIIAQIWSPAPLRQLMPRGEKMTVRYEHAVAEFRCEVARLLVPINRSMFGHGIGRKLASAIGSAVKARAALLDIARTAALQPEGVASFLAGLPADRTGKPAPLPVIRPL